MAILINDGSVIQINALGALLGQQTVTTFFYQWGASTPGNPVTMGEVLEVVKTQLSAEFVDCCSEDFTLDAWEGRDPHTPPIFANGILHDGAVGAISSPSEATQVAAVISRMSGLPGRSNRGRIFMPGVPSNSVNDGIITDPALTQLVSFSFTMRGIVSTVLEPGELTPVVFSKKLNTVKQLDSTIVRTIPHTQRRRTIGVGV